jgi:hypothetical protein
MPEFHEKWINWVIETANKEVLGKVGEKCYMNIEWVNALPEFSGEKTKENMLAFLQRTSPEILYTPTKIGIRVNLNNKECYCPLVKSGITSNPKLCEGSKNFYKLMCEKILNTEVEIEIKETVLRNNSSCIFEVIIPE